MSKKLTLEQALRRLAELDGYTMRTIPRCEGIPPRPGHENDVDYILVAPDGNDVQHPRMRGQHAFEDEEYAWAWWFLNGVGVPRYLDAQAGPGILLIVAKKQRLQVALYCSLSGGYWTQPTSLPMRSNPSHALAEAILSADAQKWVEIEGVQS